MKTLYFGIFAISETVFCVYKQTIKMYIFMSRYTFGVDMWSCGCILGEMLLGKSLFPGTSTLNQIEKIMASIPPPTHEGQYYIPHRHLVRCMEVYAYYLV